MSNKRTRVNKLLIISTGVWSLLFTVAVTLTNTIDQLQQQGTLKTTKKLFLEFGDIPHILLDWTIVWIIALLFLAALKRMNFTYVLVEKLNMWEMKRIAGLLLIVWIPFLAVFYPSVGMNDTVAIINGPWSSSIQHPFFYCMYLGTFCKVSNYLFGTKVYGLLTTTLLQMVFMAGSIAYVLVWLKKKIKNKLIFFGLFCYFAFFPIIGNYAIAAVKDTMFSIVLLLWIPFLYDVFVKEKNFVIDIFYRRYFYLLSFLTMALRNNGKYVYIVLLCLLVFKCVAQRKTILKYGVIFLIICSLPNFYLMKFWNMPQLFQEAVAVPLQQVARTIAVGGTVTDADKVEIAKWMQLEDLKKAYQPYTVDTIKYGEDFDRDYFNTHGNEFMKIWINNFSNNKVTYANAWFAQTFGIWGTKTQNWVDQSRFGFALTDDIICRGVKPYENNILKTGSLSLPDDIKTSLSTYMFNQSGFINPGNCFWIMTFIGLLFIAKKRYAGLVVLIPIFLCWGTLLAAVPASFVYRYVFMYPLCLPVLVFIPFISERKG